MIDFRYHVVSIVAVFLALTVGLVLGASFLKGSLVQNLNDSITSLTTQRNNAQQSDRILNNELGSQNSYIAGTAPILVQGYLAGVDVAVVEISGSDPALTADTLTLLAAAGAKVTSDVTVTAKLTATDAATEAALSTAVVANLPAGQSPVSGPAAVQGGNLLAQAITVQPPPADATGGATGGAGGPTGSPTGSAGGGAGATVTPTAPATGGAGGTGGGAATAMTAAGAQQVLSAFTGGGYITVNNVAANLKPATPAKPTMVFIAAPTTVNTPAQNAAYLSLAEALQADGATPVMGGAAENNTSGSVQSGGLIDAVFKDGTANKQISTVDNMNQTTGQVAVVFTLCWAKSNAAAASPDPAKHYGTVASTTQGQLPPIAPLPVPTVNPSGSTTAGNTSGNTPAH